MAGKYGCPWSHQICWQQCGCCKDCTKPCLTLCGTYSKNFNKPEIAEITHTIMKIK